MGQRWEAVPPATYDAWFDRPWGRQAFAVERAAVLGALGKVSGRRVLEVGCGTGRMVRALGEDGAVAIGLDSDPAMARFARRLSGAPVLEGDAACLPCATASVDASIAIALVEFVADPAAVVAELVRVVRPGGRVVIGALNPRSFWGLAQRGKHRRAPWAGVRFLRRHELRALGLAHGRPALRAALFAPGPMPGWLGRCAERLGALVPWLGAFQVLVIERPGRGALPVGPGAASGRRPRWGRDLRP